jgi:hypothetical protein
MYLHMFLKYKRFFVLYGIINITNVIIFKPVTKRNFNL